MDRRMLFQKVEVDGRYEVGLNYGNVILFAKMISLQRNVTDVAVK